MYNKQNIGWMYLCILSSSAILPILCYPSLTEVSKVQPHLVLPEGRKYAEKPNATKKTQTIEDRHDLEDITTNQIQQDNGGFTWGSMLSMIMQLFFNPQQTSGPSKSDVLDNDQTSSNSPWTNLLSMGLKILSAILTGNGNNIGNDGIDKVDHSVSNPMQFIHIVMNLLEALKTSFSQRSMNARSLGKKDTISEAAIASITMFKGYMRSMKTSNDACMQKYVCDAYRECADGLNSPSSTYCQLGTYAASAALHRSTGMPFEKFNSAARVGRSGEDCRKFYLTCDEA
ncbi:uncharacterized protein LOC135837377 isoform X2 [Planococcus citri]|uniref:uncharacterized protein LOC135837377 isoform X2 n=1 Tax=Planococcus citri TaxID=170843 RepID=UPI0031F962E9